MMRVSRSSASGSVVVRLVRGRPGGRGRVRVRVRVQVGEVRGGGGGGREGDGGRVRARRCRGFREGWVGGRLGGSDTPPESIAATSRHGQSAASPER